MDKTSELTVGCQWQGGWRADYWKNFGFCEVRVDPERAPRFKTLERWRENAPESAEFVLWIDDIICASGFSGDNAAKAWDATLHRAQLLNSTTLALRTPAHFRPNSQNIDAMTCFLRERIPEGTTVAWWAEGLWEGQLELQEELCRDLGMTAVADPLAIDDPADLPSGERFYWRIRGRRGMRGGFSDFELYQLLQLAESREGGRIFFTSNDMLRDARQFLSLLAAS